MQATKPATEKNVEVGIFLDVDSAARAVGQLLEAGFTKEHITVVCSDENKEKYFREYEHQEPAGTFTPRAAAAGGTLGALLGALPVLSIAAVTGGGVLILVVGAAAAGALGIAGGLVGAMMTRGVEKEVANYYQQAVLDGKLLVAADCEGPNCNRQLSEAARIFAAAGAKPLTLPEG
jgi:hypothetical protein